MLGLKRRKHIEGWAIDIPENGYDNSSVLKRLSDSNKFWVGCFIAVILLAIFFIKTSHYFNSSNFPNEPPKAPEAYRNYERYLQFSEDFQNDKRFRDVVKEAQFLEPGRFRVIVPYTVSADEIHYVAKLAAELIRHEFNHKVVVQVYMKRPTQRIGDLAASALWSRKQNGFVVMFTSSEE